MIDIQGFLKARPFLKAGLGAYLLCLAGVAAQAGDGNQIYILQQSSLGHDAGNSLNVDQSAATGSTVAGAFGAEAATKPALQIGVGNTGTIDISGANGQVVFLQEGVSNAATVNLSSALGMAYLQQDGTANTASLTVDPLGLNGAIQQIGSGNQADLTVGTGASGSLVQKGDNNQFGFAVSGAGTTASYTAIGNNMAPAGTGPIVISNGGSVTITQTQLR